MEGLLFLIIIAYIVCHIPAIVLLILGLSWRKTKPQTSKTLLILAAIYFVIGGGICGMLLT